MTDYKVGDNIKADPKHIFIIGSSISASTDILMLSFFITEIALDSPFFFFWPPAQINPLALITCLESSVNTFALLGSTVYVFTMVKYSKRYFILAYTKEIVIKIKTEIMHILIRRNLFK